MLKINHIIPFALFIILALFLFKGLNLNPQHLPSALIGKPTPTFQLPLLFQDNQVFNQNSLKNKISIVNIWASWCQSCLHEHSFLLSLQQNNQLPPRSQLIGINYKDNPETAKSWLRKQGNPYQWILVDARGKTAIDWGVMGTPETFIIDQLGIIRHRHVGPLTEDNWQQDFIPLINQLNKSS